MQKKVVLLLFGGVSCEHEISLLSVQAIFNNLDRARFTPLLLAITKEGKWLYFTTLSEAIRNPDDAKSISLGEDKGTEGFIHPQTQTLWAIESNQAAPMDNSHFDVIFPVLHGPYGEDGSLQGYFQLFHLPFVGADCLGSAVSMDKAVMKRLLAQAGISVPPFLVIHANERTSPQNLYQNIVSDLKPPLFIKPCNLGSSVGIFKVHCAEEFDRAVLAAFQFDNKIIVEQAVSGRELECSVLGNESPRASRLGEIVPAHDFYSYEAKYLDPSGARLIVPAQLEEKKHEEAKHLAIRAFQAVECMGMARVDMFLEKGTGKLIVNELNTIPGFTQISMYPKLWDVSGLSFQSLVTELISLGIENFEKRERLKKIL